MTDVSFRSAGYALKIEEDPQQKTNWKRNTYAPFQFGSKIFAQAQLKITIYSKDFLAIYMTICLILTCIVGNNQNNNSTNRQQINNTILSNQSHTSYTMECLWWYVLQFIFKVVPIAVSTNTAADFSSRLEVKVTEKIRIEIREDIQTIHIEVHMSSSDVATKSNSFSQPKTTSTQTPRNK